MMSITNNISLFFFLVIVLMACKADPAELPTIEKNGPVTHFSAALKYADTTTLRTIAFTGGVKPTPNAPTNYVFTGADASVGELGNTLIIAGAQFNIIGELYRLQFWAPDFPVDRLWNPSEIEQFFALGRTFTFGSGVGKVDIGIALPRREPFDVELSRPTYLAAPEGELIVENIEDYDYPVYSIFFQLNQRSYGKLVECSFSGQIGRYDGLADQADGDPSFYQTDEVVELSNGKVIFYLEYERI